MDWSTIAGWAAVALVFVNLFWAVAWSNAREAEANAKRPAPSKTYQPRTEPSAFYWPNPTRITWPIDGTVSHTRTRTASLSVDQKWRERSTDKVFRIHGFDRDDGAVLLAEDTILATADCRRVDTAWFFDEADLVTEDTAKEPEPA
jgi:hypothetical protein